MVVLVVVRIVVTVLVVMVVVVEHPTFLTEYLWGTGVMGAV